MLSLTYLTVFLTKFVLQEVSILTLADQAYFEGHFEKLVRNSSCDRLYPDGFDSLDRYNDSADPVDHLVYCIAHERWFNHSNSDHPSLDRSVCDKAMSKPLVVNWSALDAVTRKTLDDCAKRRLTVEALYLSNKTRYSWLPLDVQTSPQRPYLMLLQAQHALNTWLQYDADRSLDTTTLLSQSYRRMWHDAGLYTKHYHTITDCHSLEAFRANHTMTHYRTWNQVTQSQLAMAISAYRSIVTALLPS